MLTFNRSMNIVIVGCGYVADFYMKTFSSYPNLKLSGANDTKPVAAFPPHC